MVGQIRKVGGRKDVNGIIEMVKHIRKTSGRTDVKVG